MSSSEQPEKSFSENPYAASIPQTSLDPNTAFQSGGLVNQVLVIGILQIVLGVMELMMAGLLIFYAILFGFVMPNMDNPNSEEIPPEAMFWIALGCGVGGAVVLVFALLRIVAGTYSFWFKQRTMMMVSLIGGMITVFTCYCSLFSVGVGIYGLIVMWDPAVRQAYRMAAAGMSADEIKARFARARYGF